MATNMTGSPAIASLHPTVQDLKAAINALNEFLALYNLNNDKVALVDLIALQRNLMDVLYKSFEEHRTGTSQEMHQQQEQAVHLVKITLPLATMLAKDSSTKLQDKQSRIDKLEDGIRKLLNSSGPSMPCDEVVSSPKHPSASENEPKTKKESV